jgi:hypothetical protein
MSQPCGNNKKSNKDIIWGQMVPASYVGNNHKPLMQLYELRYGLKKGHFTCLMCMSDLPLSFRTGPLIQQCQFPPLIPSKHVAQFKMAPTQSQVSILTYY